MTEATRYDTTPGEPIYVHRLSHGPWHVRGVGQCNWATVSQWPCSEQTIRDGAGAEACEEFIRAAVRAAESEAAE